MFAVLSAAACVGAEAATDIGKGGSGRCRQFNNRPQHGDDADNHAKPIEAAYSHLGPAATVANTQARNHQYCNEPEAPAFWRW
jgi:hypothetical protein